MAKKKTKPPTKGAAPVTPEPEALPGVINQARQFKLPPGEFHVVAEVDEVLMCHP